MEDDPYLSFHSSDDYDLADPGLEIADSPRETRADSISVRGLSRIGSRISTRWKSRRSSDGPDEDGFHGSPRDSLSRPDSPASSLGSPGFSPISRREAFPPSPSHTTLDESTGSTTRPVPIAKACDTYDDSIPQANTPLLPPFMGDNPTSAVASKVHSPLQSPSVADATDERLGTSITDLRSPDILTPPLSSKPSVASLTRPPLVTRPTASGEATPFTLSDPNDEWANKLGHANFTIQPQPYVPEVRDLESFQQFRTQWEMARCNFARHLVRTGEHNGLTSNIYKLTEEKWESINREWKRNHEAMLSDLGSGDGACLGLTNSHLNGCEQLQIPRLHDNKFPELGDQEIVGPMKIGPAIDIPRAVRYRSVKRDFVRFFQDLVTKP